MQYNIHLCFVDLMRQECRHVVKSIVGYARSFYAVCWPVVPLYVVSAGSLVVVLSIIWQAAMAVLSTIVIVMFAISTHNSCCVYCILVSPVDSPRIQPLSVASNDCQAEDLFIKGCELIKEVVTQRTAWRICLIRVNKPGLSRLNPEKFSCWLRYQSCTAYFLLILLAPSAMQTARSYKWLS